MNNIECDIIIINRYVSAVARKTQTKAVATVIVFLFCCLESSYTLLIPRKRIKQWVLPQSQFFLATALYCMHK